MMNKNFFNFSEVFIDEEVRNNPELKIVLNNLTNNPKISYINDAQKFIKGHPVIYSSEERAKKLLLTKLKGEILKKCPGSLGHLCCNYYVINIYLGCPINCSYCILQSYLNTPFVIININIDEIFAELDKILSVNKNKIFRIGTGELGDSLVYDKITNFSGKFIEFFSKHSNAIFEFKTKTDFIDDIIKHKNPGNIVLGFSVNPQLIVSTEEMFAASLKERLISCREAVKHKYKIAFHFDPIINIENYKEEYLNLIKMIFEYVNTEDISWISLGTFRYTRELKKMIEYNYPGSELLNDEFVECQDYKFRYFKSVRLEIYNYIINCLKEFGGDQPVYLCMESPEVWEDALGFLPCKKKLGVIF